MPAGTNSGKRPLIRRIVRATVLSGLVLALGGIALYPFSGAVLTVDSGPSRAEAIVVLGGGVHERSTHAADLYAAKRAPWIVASGEGDCQQMVAALKRLHVPAGAICTEDKSRDTFENARLSVALLREKGITNAIVVTSWYHSRRAINTFRKVAPEIQFFSSPSYYGIQRKNWGPEGLSRRIRLEYAKLLAYWVVHGVRPWS